MDLSWCYWYIFICCSRGKFSKMTCLLNWSRTHFFKSTLLLILDSVSQSSESLMLIRLPMLLMFSLLTGSCFRWPHKKYTIICPPPFTKKTPLEGSQGSQEIGQSCLPRIARTGWLEGVDLMFHYLMVSLRCADGKHRVTVKADIFCWTGRAQVIANSSWNSRIIDFDISSRIRLSSIVL